MIKEQTTYRLTFSPAQDPLKGVFIVIVHATRIPPHIGMVIAGNYHSLSVKGQNINVPVNTLLKNSALRKIPTVFVKIKPHLTFSEDYLNEHFITNVRQFKRVDKGVATCLSPLKLFFEEVYSLHLNDVNYLYELLPLLDSVGLIESTTSCHLDEVTYKLPIYTNKEINEGIDQVRKDFKDQ
ncbi:MAG: hypothetical protein H0X46_07840 [Bacteroidetes bacterium]|nr:hypothetical protein [Bacteroidota bacterium]